MGLLSAQDWISEAACRDKPAALFFPESYEYQKRAEAIRVCNSCTVKDQCLDYAIDNHIDKGIWGGMTERDRRKEQRRRRFLR